MSDRGQNEESAAIRLVLAVKRLRSRLRAEAHLDSTGLSTSQISLLSHLYQSGPSTASALAAVEHVSQQAIAQTIAPLKAAGLVESEPDPGDGRKTLIRITERGRSLRDSLIASRDAWLVRAIDRTISAEERPALDKTIELLERLADADC